MRHKLVDARDAHMRQTLNPKTSRHKPPAEVQGAFRDGVDDVRLAKHSVPHGLKGECQMFTSALWPVLRAKC